MRFSKFFAAGAGALLASTVMVAAAHAATNVYADAASFNATLSSSIVDDYSNPGYVFIQGDEAMSGVLGETRYASTGFSNLNIVTGRYCAGCNGSFSLFFDETSLGTMSGVFGVGFNFENRFDFYSALVTFGDGDSALYALPTPEFPKPANPFFGITSDRRILSIAVGPNGLPAQEGFFAIDNLTIGSGAPEPSTWAIMLTGFGSVGAMLRRRRQVALTA